MSAAEIAVSTINTVQGETKYLWETLDGDDYGAVVRLPPGTNSLTAQLGAAGGNTAGGSTTYLQGSNDEIAKTDPTSAVWFTLTEKYTASTAVSRTTTEVLKEVKELPSFIRPYQINGIAGDMDVVVVARRDC